MQTYKQHANEYAYESKMNSQIGGKSNKESIKNKTFKGKMVMAVQAYI